MESEQESAQQEQKLERAEKEDSGRGLEFFWMNGEIGVEHIGLQTFKKNGLLDTGVVKTTQTGVAFGGGLGVRLLFLSIGARFRMGSFSEWQLWTLGAEVGYRIPIGNLEPYFTLGGGYASLGGFGSDNIGSGLKSANVDISGYYIRGGAGLDYYVTPVFSIGATLTGELIGLSRPGVKQSDLTQPSGTTESVYLADGSSLGFGGTLMAVIGLHF